MTSVLIALMCVAVLINRYNWKTLEFRKKRKLYDAIISNQFCKFLFCIFGTLCSNFPLKFYILAENYGVMLAQALWL